MTGLRRHSRSNAMWKALYNLKSTQARLLSDPLQRRQAYGEILLFNELWNANVLVQQSDRFVQIAGVHEKLGHWDIALDLLQQAQRAAQHGSQQQQAEILSRLAILKAQMITSEPST